MEANRYRETISFLKKDSAFVRDSYTDRYKVSTHERTARDLACQKNGEAILIISDVSKYGSMHKHTLNIIKASENIQKTKKDYISITHPCEETLDKMKEEFLKNPRVEARSHVKFVPFSELYIEIEKSAVVYCGLPMGNDADNEIIYAWKSKVNAGNTMVHIRGSINMHGDDMRGESSGEWLKLEERDDYVSPEAITKENNSRWIANQILAAEIREIYKICAAIREKGKSPSYEIKSGAYNPVYPVLEA